MNLIAFSGPRNCVNTQYAALSGAMNDCILFQRRAVAVVSVVKDRQHLRIDVVSVRNL